MGAFDLVGTEVLAVLSYEMDAQSALHGSYAAAAKVDSDSPMPVIVVFAEFVEPPIHDRGDSTILRSDCGVRRDMSPHCFTLWTCGA